SVVALPILAANAAVAPFEVSASSLGGRTAAEFAYIVIFGTVVAFVCWFKGINRTSPVRTTVYQFMTPLVSTLLGAVVLGEHVGGGHAAGAMLICGGLLAARYDPAGAPQAKAKNKRAGRETCRKGEYCQR
ncbi:MAG TPA: DMT family transporter, partial [Negativicutes bacterium]|nr:DMT family transporter [Negativicutes bacterium]